MSCNNLCQQGVDLDSFINAIVLLIFFGLFRKLLVFIVFRVEKSTFHSQKVSAYKRKDQTSTSLLCLYI